MSDGTSTGNGSGTDTSIGAGGSNGGRGSSGAGGSNGADGSNGGRGSNDGLTLTRLAGTFVAVLALTLGVVAIGTVALDPGTPAPPAVENAHFQPDDGLPEAAPEGGEVTMESTGPPNTVVVHTGSAAAAGQQPIPVPLGAGDRHELATGTLGGPDRGVGPLASALAADGHEVRFYADEMEDGPLEETLADADALVTIAPGALSASQRETVDEFVRAGGRVVVAGDPGASGAATEIGSTTGIYAEPGYLYNLVENDQNYLGIVARPSGSSELTDGVDEVVFRGAAVVGTSRGGEVLRSGGDTRLSTTRERGTYGVAARSGDVALIGDSSFLAPENAYRADNDVLIGNLAEFLVGGQKTGGIDVGGPADEPIGEPGIPPDDVGQEGPIPPMGEP